MAGEENASQRLAEIADLVGCSVTELKAQASDGLEEQTRELLSLWLSIADPESRASLLAYARAIGEHRDD